jgi:PAS domain S-box-containing protein
MKEMDWDAIKSLCQDDAAFEQVKGIIEEQINEYQERIDELSKKEAYLRLVLNMDPNFIFVRDREGRFVLVNNSMAKVFGMPEEKIIGKTDEELINDDDEIQMIRQNDQLVLSTDAPHIIPERRIFDADGQERWMRIFKSPIHPSENDRDQIIAIAQDITDQKKSLLKFKRLKERYEALLLSKADFIWVISSDGFVTEPSESWLKHTGQTYEEAINEGWMHALHIEDRPRFFRKMMQSFDALNTLQTQCRIRTTDGEYKYYEVWAAPVIDESDNTVLEWMVGATLSELLQESDYYK